MHSDTLHLGTVVQKELAWANHELSCHGVSKGIMYAQCRGVRHHSECARTSACALSCSMTYSILGIVAHWVRACAQHELP